MYALYTNLSLSYRPRGYFCLSLFQIITMVAIQTPFNYQLAEGIMRKSGEKPKIIPIIFRSCELKDYTHIQPLYYK